MKKSQLTVTFSIFWRDYHKFLIEKSSDRNAISKSKKVFLAYASYISGSTVASCADLPDELWMPYLPEQGDVERTLTSLENGFRLDAGVKAGEQSPQTVRNLMSFARKMLTHYVSNYPPVDNMVASGGRVQSAIRPSEALRKAQVQERLAALESVDPFMLGKKFNDLAAPHGITIADVKAQMRKNNHDSLQGEYAAYFRAAKGEGRKLLVTVRNIDRIKNFETAFLELLSKVDPSTASGLKTGFLSDYAVLAKPGYARTYIYYKDYCRDMLAGENRFSKPVSEFKLLKTKPVWNEVRHFCERKVEEGEWSAYSVDYEVVPDSHVRCDYISLIAGRDCPSALTFARSVQNFFRVVQASADKLDGGLLLESEMTLWCVAVPEFLNLVCEHCHSASYLERYETMLLEFFTKGSSSKFRLYAPNNIDQEVENRIPKRYLNGRTFAECLDKSFKVVKLHLSRDEIIASKDSENSRVLQQVKKIYKTYPIGSSPAEFYVDIDKKIRDAEKIARSLPMHSSQRCMLVRKILVCGIHRTLPLRTGDVSRIKYSPVPTTEINTLWFDASDGRYKMNFRARKNLKKSDFVLRAEFNEWVLEWINHWRSSILEKSSFKDSNFLFAKTTGKKGYSRTQKDTQMLIGEISGVLFTSHNWRHLLGFIFVNRGEAGLAAKFLGDSIETVIKHYSLTSADTSLHLESLT